MAVTASANLRLNPARLPEGEALDRLDARHFHEIARLVQENAGIVLPPAKQTMVEGRLRRRVRALGFRSLNDYGRALFETGLLGREFPFVVDCVTTNKTDFFREPQQFELLATRLLDEWRDSSRRGREPIKFWSAAASIGAEAYTLAMVAADRLGLSSGAFSILGTDISETVIETARAAIYSQAMAEPIPPALRERYLMFARDPRREEFRIVPELRRCVRFDALNLMDETYPHAKNFDAIFCRNVLIYFARETQTAVIDRLVAHLRIGGCLFLGHSETMSTNRPDRLRQIASSVFRKER